jgi:GT2 family glycosyltransferase
VRLPDVSVVIVAYRTPDLVDKCLASLAAHVLISYEVIVVDNFPGDGTGELVRNQYRNVTLMENASNIGFAAAVNRGAARAQGRYVLLLNPDTEVYDDAVGALVEFADSHPEYGVYGGRTVSTTGSLDPRSCFGATTMWSSLCWALGLSVVFRKSLVFDPESLGDWKRDTVRPVAVVTGCLLMASRVLWDELKGMDDRYFLFGEDIDFCQRAIAAGAQPVLVPTATILHHYGASTSSKPERVVLLLAGRATVFHSHWSRTRARIGTSLLVLGVLIRFAGWRLFETMTGRAHHGGSMVYWAAWRQRRRWKAGYLQST